ncbi:preprotein translocase subunit SecG [Aquimarina sp. EL_43]|uniref:hypothetical protein n=1 Tax=Aquimarina TaxID=290174 RepID=UPI000471CB8C|nr:MULTISPECIES: hypothetical protein [Aquimarina]MBG6132434.1 preprotein translocase subunit SecG [Aquimarina sp. EL_35]MBG6152565.1 preprotein translocase subunit SecG [Aquimarina sp. EL_32]MBG6170508.1 preprotein translocase subunit SecG [Aquimarina sp. EL_43]
MEEQYKDIKGLVKEAGLETPSVNFLKNVMDQVELSAIEVSPVYKPLISKKVWFVVGVAVAVLLCTIPFLSESKESILSTIDFSFFNKISFKNPFSEFTFHKTTIYGILFLALLFLIQITILKRRIDRRFSL